MEPEQTKSGPSLLGNFFQGICVLWSIGIISYSYLSPTSKIDTTFCAGILTSMISSLTGVQVSKKETDKKRVDPDSTKEKIKK